MTVPAGTFGDLVVVIPGILGSRLKRTEGGRTKTVWDLSMGNLSKSLRALASGSLALGSGDGPPDDGVEAVDLLGFQLLPGFFGVDDYASLVDNLSRAVGADQLLTFPYDWRASNRHAAERLESRALGALQTWKETSGNDDARLWLVCHSMGGLVARYFCEHLGGSRHTRAIVTVGTPHRGSVPALEALVNGKRYGPLDLTALVRSLPSVYELLPLFPVVRQGTGATMDLRRVAELYRLDPSTGEDVAEPGLRQPPPLPGIERDMLQRALRFHSRIRGPALQRAADGRPSPYEQFVFFNRRQQTLLSARLKGAALELFTTYPEPDGAGWVEQELWGDGTVPSFSSVPIEWDTTEDAVAVGDKHASMQAAVSVRDSIVNWLRPLDVRAKRGPGRAVGDAAVVRLDVPDTIVAGEELAVKLASVGPMNAIVDLHHCETGARLTRPVGLPGGQRLVPVSFSRPEPGAVRITVTPRGSSGPPVTDFTYVIHPSLG